MTDEERNGCCQRSRPAKVRPAPGTNPDIVELRPGRPLRIQHINSRPRDSQIVKELQIYLKNPETAARYNLNLPKTPQNAPVVEFQSNHPNDVLPTSEKPQKNEEKEKVSRPSSFYNKNSQSDIPPSRTSMSRDSVLSQGIMSSSNVEVIMEPHKPIVSHSKEVMSEIDEKDEQTSVTTRSNKSKMSEDTKIKAERNSNTDGSNNANAQNSGLPDADLVLFFIHGVGGSSEVWKKQLDYFARLGYEIVCPDMIGHGLSCAPNDPKCYHFKDILFDMEAMFDTYCKRKNVIIGHSYGCAFATVLARQRSRQVAKLVLVSGGGPFPLAPQPGIFSLPLCMQCCLKPCITCLFRRGGFHSNTKPFVEKKKAFDIPSYVLDYVMNGQWWMDGDDLYHSFISMPTLLLWGRHDKFVSLEEEVAMHKTIIKCKLEVIEEAGHMVMMEAPDEVNKHIHKFIQEKYYLHQKYSNFTPRMQNIHQTNVSNQQDSNSKVDQFIDQNVGASFECHDEDDVSKSESSHWFSPRKSPRPSSRHTSTGSIRSVKSSKSRKSMPKGVLTHSLL